MNYVYKYIIIGDSNVGKSTITAQFTDGTNPMIVNQTIGVEFAERSISLNNNDTVKIQIWDAAGNEAFQTIVNSYYRNAVGVILTYCVDDIGSFNSVRKWIATSKKQCSKNMQMILVANKVDVPIYERVVTPYMGKQLADECDINYIEVSGKTGKNVFDMFKNLSEIIHSTTSNKSATVTGVTLLNPIVDIPDKKSKRRLLSECCTLS